MPEVTLPYHWKPRPDQLPFWCYVERGGNRAVVAAHRRWGKDEVALRLTSVKVIEKPATYWHMLPKYDQCRKAIWQAINPKTGLRRIDEAFPKAIVKKRKEQEMFIEFINGSTWQLVGSDNYNSVVGSPPYGVVYSEYALADPMSWAYISPILEENGGWAIFISTSRGDNHFKKLVDYAEASSDWFCSIIPATDTKVFKAKQLEQIKKDLIGVHGTDLGTAIFNQEYMCSFEGATLGAYWAEQMLEAELTGRITYVPHQPSFEVFTAWDLGLNDKMAIWFIQQIGQQYHVIDYEEGIGKGLDYYAKLLKDKGYVYGTHYFPHDVKARELSSGTIARSRLEVAESLGIRPIEPVPRTKTMYDIINKNIPAVRSLLPKCYFDKDNCKQGIAALKAFRAKWDTNKKTLLPRYSHDWASDAASAFMTFTLGHKEHKEEIPEEVINRHLLRYSAGFGVR